MQPDGRTDAELERAIVQGDEAAFVALYRCHAGMIYGLLVRMLRSLADAEDALQETFIKAWKARERYNPAESRFSTWVYAIARCHAIDELRKRKVVTDEMPAPATISETPDDRRAEELVEVIRLRLPSLVPQLVEILVPNEKDRAALTHYFSAGTTIVAVAQTMGANAGSLRMALHRFLKRLREIAPAVIRWVEEGE